MTKRRRVYARYGKAEVGYEWVGFRDAGTQANLDTTAAFELFPPFADQSIGTLDMTVLRVVGDLQIMKQAGIVSGDAMGITLVAADVGDDQTVDEAVNPLSTDVDEFHNNTIMWWWSGRPAFPVAMADADLIPWRIPLDIRVKRILRKRTRLVFNCTAATTGRLRVSCNVRVLVRKSAKR